MGYLTTKIDIESPILDQIWKP